LRGRQSPTAGRVIATLFGVALGLGVVGASAADRLAPAKMPIGTMSLAPSLDTLAWSAPRFGTRLLNHRPAASRQWYARLAFVQSQTRIAGVFESRFSGFAAEASPSQTVVATISGQARPKQASAALAAIPRHVAKPVLDDATAAPVELAYADPSPTAASDAIDALSIPTQDGTGPMTDVTADLPLSVPLPNARPGKPAAVEQPAELEDKTTRPPTARKLALAKPENPIEPAAPPPSAKKDKSGFSLRNLFGGTKRAGNGVAVYDISAAKVYMPDGSVLEAHSGIGEMADNPRYAHVKMNGPTPPHTYRLKMRERRFHGVEAIRMLPIDGRNKHGRDGFLTHSYLLRGRAGQSHGCVAFKDYAKFLKAFKSGQVTQMVVVSGGGKAVARASQKGRNT
jgi:hypothetical protein